MSTRAGSSYCSASQHGAGVSSRGYGATATRLTPDQKVGSTNFSAFVIHLMLTTGNPRAESASLAVSFFVGKDVHPTVHLRGSWAVSINGSHSSVGQNVLLITVRSAVQARVGPLLLILESTSMSVAHTHTQAPRSGAWPRSPHSLQGATPSCCLAQHCHATSRRYFGRAVTASAC